MSRPIRRGRLRHVCLTVSAAGLLGAAAAAPVQASPVLLGTVAPFVALGGTTITNTGPSVLDGDLGVAPGTALVGFGAPAVVNGASHAADGVAAQAQSRPHDRLHGGRRPARRARRRPDRPGPRRPRADAPAPTAPPRRPS